MIRWLCVIPFFYLSGRDAVPKLMILLPGKVSNEPSFWSSFLQPSFKRKMINANDKTSDSKELFFYVLPPQLKTNEVFGHVRDTEPEKNPKIQGLKFGVAV